MLYRSRAYHNFHLLLSFVFQDDFSKVLKVMVIVASYYVVFISFTINKFIAIYLIAFLVFASKRQLTLVIIPSII